MKIEEIDAEAVQAALERTGFLFEQKAFQFVRKELKRLTKNTLFRPFSHINQPYVDIESSKLREIDVLSWVTGPLRKGDYGAWLSGGLVIECKNTRMPYAVIGSQSEHQDLFTSGPMAYVDNDPHRFRWEGLGWGSSLYRLRLGTIPQSPSFPGFFGTQLIRLELNNGNLKADNAGVHDSITLPLGKAVYDQKMQMKAEEEGKGFAPEYAFFLPVILVNSPVFRVDVDGEQVSVERRPWVPMVRDFGEPVKKIVFDVVSFDAFGEYIEERFWPFIQAVKDRLLDFDEMNDPEHLLNAYGEPREKKDEFDTWKYEVGQERQRVAHEAN